MAQLNSENQTIPNWWERNKSKVFTAVITLVLTLVGGNYDRLDEFLGAFPDVKDKVVTLELQVQDINDRLSEVEEFINSVEVVPETPNDGGRIPVD